MMATKERYAHLAHFCVGTLRKILLALFFFHQSTCKICILTLDQTQTTSSQRLLRSSDRVLRFSRFSIASPLAAAAATAAQPYWKHPLEFPNAAVLVTQKVKMISGICSQKFSSCPDKCTKTHTCFDFRPSLAACAWTLTFVDVFCSGGLSRLSGPAMWFAVICGDVVLKRWLSGGVGVHIVSGSSFRADLVYSDPLLSVPLLPWFLLYSNSIMPNFICYLLFLLSYCFLLLRPSLHPLMSSLYWNALQLCRICLVWFFHPFVAQVNFMKWQECHVCVSSAPQRGNKSAFPPLTVWA